MLFVGLMIGTDGPQVIEFNVRFGDPETQVMLPRLRGDLLALLIAAANGQLPTTPIALSDDSALTVVLAAPGYPEAPRTGDVIGLDAAEHRPDVQITHAGTRRTPDGLVASGGRVLNVTGLGPDLPTARTRAYDAVRAVDWSGAVYRQDIGWRAMPR